MIAASKNTANEPELMNTTKDNIIDPLVQSADMAAVPPTNVDMRTIPSIIVCALHSTIAAKV